MRILPAVVCFLVLATAARAQNPPAAALCERLSSLKLANTNITLAEVVAPGTFISPPQTAPSPPPAGAFSDLPAFCRVAGTLRPSNDSDIKIEVWLPISGWNGKFQGIGSGGWGGFFPHATPFSSGMADALRRGYATASTNTGHIGDSSDGTFSFGHPEKLVDFAHRAVHEMTVQAKSIVKAYYGDGARLSYWNGCSSGGRQGLKEAQKYPADYDGIIAGAPALNWTRTVTHGLWVAHATLKDPASYIPPEKYAVIHNAVLEACDTMDGVKDGVLDDPTRCRFDPGVLLCKGTETATCLTSPQVEAARKIYGAAKNPRMGAELSPGKEPGSELGWAAAAGGPAPNSLGTDHFKYVVLNNPKWDWKTLDFDKDIAVAERIDNGLINATDPNLEAFFGRGGKILMYHGWSDQLIPPRFSINYYTSVVKKMGGVAKASTSIRLFMVPGMNHCFGGDGTSNFDRVAALEQWVEQKRAPDEMIGSHVTGTTADRTRPLCPYPQVARYKGTGSVNEAANFACEAP
jgi:feruloyl esterase